MERPNRSDPDRGAAIDAAGLLQDVAGRRDPLAAERLVHLYTGRLRGLAFRILGDREAAEDVVQDVFLGLLAGRIRYSGRGHPDAFLLRAAGYIAIDRARRTGIRRRKEEEAMALRLERSRSCGEMDPAAREELETEIGRLLAGLEPEARAALALRFWDDRTVRETAAVLDAPRSTVQRWIDAAIERLRRPLILKGFGAAGAVALLGDLLRGMDPPPSPGFAASISEALRSGKPPPDDLPEIPDVPLIPPPAIHTLPVLGAGAAAIAIALAGVLVLTSWNRTPRGPAGQGPVAALPAPADAAPGGPPAPAAEAGRAAPAAAAIDGTVHGPGGAPARGARVRLYAGERPRQSEIVPRGAPLAETAAEGGRFAFRDLSPGSYRVLALMGGSRPGLSGLLRLADGEATTVAIDLPAGGVAEGACRSPSGDPVAGTRVWAWIPIRLGEMEVGTWAESAESGADGRIRLSGIDPSGTAVSVRSDLHHIVSRPWQVGSDDPFEVVLSAGVAVSGSVVDPEGQPAAGAEVLAFASPREGYNPWDSWILARRSESGAEGRFELRGLPTRDVAVFARKAGLAISEGIRIDLSLGAPPREPIAVSLRKGEAIEGRFAGGGKTIGPATGFCLPREAGGEEEERPNGRTVFLFSDQSGKVSSRLEVAEFPVDGEGRFATPPLPPGEYVFHVFRDEPGIEYSDGIRAYGGPRRPKAFRPGERGVEVEASICEPVLIAGKVADEKGRGVPDALVTCSLRHSRGGATRFHGFDRGARSFKAFTDQRGAFEVERVIDPGAWEVIGVSAEAPDGRRGSIEKLSLDDRDRLRSLEIAIDAGVPIAGAVKTPSGEPMAGAAVRIEQDGDEPSPAARSRSGKTDEGGRFRFTAARDGREYRIIVEAEGWARAEAGGVEPGASIEIVLRPGTAIRGRVVDLEGNPVEPDSMLRRLNPFAPPERMEFRSEGQGRFTIWNVEPGQCRILACGKASGGGRRPQSMESDLLTVEEGKTVEGVVLVMTRLVAVTGQVVEAATGRPIAGAIVSAAGPIKVQADGDGRFRLEGIPRGYIDVTAEAEGHLSAGKGIDVDGEEDAEVRVELPSAKLLCVRVAGEDGKPLAGAEVECGRNRIRSDGSGLAKVQEGSMDLDKPMARVGIEARMEGYVSRRFMLDRARLDAGLVEVVLPRAGKIIGTVSDHRGSPSAGLQLTASRNGGDREARTDEDGAFAIAGLEAGSYEVSVTSSEVPMPKIVRSVVVSAGVESRLDVTIPDPASWGLFRVTIRAAFEDGRPAAGARLRVFDGWTGSNGASPVASQLHRDIEAGPDGRLEVLFDEPIFDVFFFGELEAEGDRFEPVLNSAEVLQGEAAVTFRRIPRGEVLLRILDAGTGKPIVRCQVYLLDKHRRRNGGTQAAPDGEYRLMAPPGEATIEVLASGYRRAELQVQVEDRGKASAEVRLEKEAR